MYLTIISIGTIGISANLAYNTFNSYFCVDDKMKNEKIYNYPLQHSLMEQINFNKSKNIIIKLPNQFINYNYPIGEIAIKKIIHKQFLKKNEVMKFNPYTNKIELVQVNEKVNKIIESCIKKQILFPNIYQDLALDVNSLSSNEVKILFDNVVKNTSSQQKDLFESYNLIVKKNIPEYVPDIIPYHQNDTFVLSKNLLSFGSDLYLLVNPSLNNECNNEQNKFNVIAMSDNREKILNHKYKDEIDECTNNGILSLLFLSIGIISGVIAYNGK